MELPTYDELPLASEGGRSGWGVFGSEDNLGLLNLLTPERLVEAASLIQRGAVFPLDAPIDAFSPPLAGSRSLPRHTIKRNSDIGFDDVYDNFYPQISSQWDSLAHIAYAPNQFWNGATEDEVATGKRNTIEHWAQRGIAGRAVLLDMVRTMAALGKPYDPGQTVRFGVTELEAARERSGLTFAPGDVLILHTGFASWFRSQASGKRAAFVREVTTPGLAQGEDMCRYLWDSRIAAIGSDTYAVEALPADPHDVFGFLHRMLIGQFGMALGEFWWTDDLAADCAEDGRYEAFLASAPMNAPGGIGSPANALAIK